MFTFSDYKRLKPGIRAVATRYWAEVVKERLGVATPNQILAKHLGEEATATPGWSNNTSRFWNRILKGQALLRENSADKTDILLPGTKAIFTHPLWQLLDCENFNQVLANRVLLTLSPDIRDRIFKVCSDGSMQRKPKVNSKTAELFFSLNSLDALTCLLTLSLEARNKGSLRTQLWFEVGVTQVFFRMATITELKAVATQVYGLISNLFNRNAEDIKRISAYDKSLPVPTRIFPAQYPQIQRALSYFDIILTLAADKGLIGEHPQDKAIFLNQVNHTNIADILMALVSIDYQHSLTVNPVSYTHLTLPTKA